MALDADGDNVVIVLDLKNAYGSINRRGFLEVLRRTPALQSALPFVETIYGAVPLQVAVRHYGGRQAGPGADDTGADGRGAG